ncbi:MAG: hypothetical protein HFI86_02465 [Bacilli bacterium]|nr:hypothetical protein [Bacilli bacterium]MCI9434127.1 hypothetical protein [Bacilli bacterium]
MTLDIQFKIKNNPYYQRYIRENSIWYKVLTRNPELFKEFEEKVKEEYKLRPTDRLERMFTTIEMIQSVIGSLK